ncbi:MAG TPA: membrane dipeptidase [Jatrophihabitantaceae bacterium]|jgi:membrane dipeptidase
MTTVRQEQKPIRLDAASPNLTPRRLGHELPRIHKGGLNTILSTVAVLEPPTTALAAIAEWWRVDADAGRPVRVATSTGQIRDAVAQDELAVVLHFQGTAPLGDNLDLIAAYQRLGLRVMQLTYNHAGLVGDGCLEDRDAGLTQFGRRVLAEMQRVGVTVDLSHVGDRTCSDALAATSGPIIASHSNARAVCDSPRNLLDEHIRAIADSGGVIGLNAFPAFVSTDPVPTLDQLIDHAVYIAELVGAAHVGLGFDYADEDEDDYDYYGYDERYYPRPPWNWPTGIASWNDCAGLEDAFSRRGFSQLEIGGILGENFLRAFDRTWRG